MTKRSPEQYATLVSKALEIVLQHLLIPSNNLRGYDTLITVLETERLPELRDKIITARTTHWNADTNALEEIHDAKLIREQLTWKLTYDLQHDHDTTDIERLENLLQRINVSWDWMPCVLSQVNNIMNIFS